ncbi:hypothetical protein AALF15_01160 [Corynebacteriaceae bacterium 7-707]
MTEWHTDMATAVLAKAARVRPASVPNNIDGETIRDWAECIEMMGLPEINDLWKEALTRWAMMAPPDKMFTPYDLRVTVEQTRDRWRDDPALKVRIFEWRYARRRSELIEKYGPEGAEMVLEGLRWQWELDENGRHSPGINSPREVTGPTDEQRAAIRGLKVTGTDD